MIDFHELRHDPAHHLGLGDVRLTIDQQEEIETTVNSLYSELVIVRRLLQEFVVPGRCNCPGAECLGWCRAARARRYFDEISGLGVQTLSPVKVRITLGDI